MIPVTHPPPLPKRKPSSHKGDFGRVLIVAGSRGMSGAAVLAGMGALRSGAGLVTIGTSESVQPIVAKGAICATTLALPETREKTLSTKRWRTLADTIRYRFDVIAIGPGLSQNPETQKLVCLLLSNLSCPVVVDADALNALAQNPKALRNLPQNAVLTPHPGEMARLTGKSVAAIQKNREEFAAGFAKKTGAVVVLKGHRTVVTDGKKIFINKTGNPGMAKGGSGDVLTGVIAALIGQKLSPFEAAALGVHLHGLAGDIANKEKGDHGLLATDIVEALPTAFKRRAK